MKQRTQQALDAINRRFYAAEAESFSASRARPWRGWERVVETLRRRRPSPAGALTVLDVGCGNGRFLAYLSGHWPGPLDYLGCDASEALLAIAARQPSAGSEDAARRARFVSCDLVASPPQVALPSGRFDLVALFGVLHHIPSFERRRALIAALGERLAPGGLLALTFWRFGELDRFDARVLPWSEFDAGGGLGTGARASSELDPRDLEERDVLLRWGDATKRVRYCHAIDDAESEALLRDLPLERIDSYRADGKGDELNQYVLLGRAPGDGA